MPELMLIAVAPEFLDYIWPGVKHFIIAALKRAQSDYNEAYIYKRLKANESVLWIAVMEDKMIAAATTEIVGILGEGRIVVITAHGGDENVYDRFLPRLEAYAVSEGCDRVRIYGRPGWVRVLASHGYEQPWVALEKKVGGGFGLEH
jgi:hypothetical protein